MSGLFISFEGMEGAGKTTQIQMLAQALERKDFSVVLTREPGGTALGSSLRSILLSQKTPSLNRIAEIFLFMADRAQHLEEVVIPALQAGKIVLCDRYIDSTLAYQSGGRGFRDSLLLDLNQLSSQGYLPRRTYLLTVNPQEGLNRASRKGAFDRFEEEELAFHERVSKKYLELAEKSPQRIKIFDGEQDILHLHQLIWNDLQSLL